MKNHNDMPLDDQTANLLDDYLDDRLAPADRAAFEALIASSPELEAECLLQKRLNQTLCNIEALEAGDSAQGIQKFQDRLADALPPARPVATSPTMTRHRPIMRWAAILGFAAIVGLGIWFGLGQQGAGPGYPDIQIVDVGAIYTHTIEQGFEPDWVCNDERFTQTIHEKFGETITLASLHTDRRMLGLSYLPRARNGTLMMLGHIKEKPVLVFFDRPNLVEPFYNLDVPEGMFIHQRDVGRLRIIEVSTQPQPVFLDSLSPDPHRQ